MNDRLDKQRKRFEAADQAHVLRFWDELGENEQLQLLEQLEAVDLELMARLAKMFEADGSEDAAPELLPPGTFPLQRNSEQEGEATRAIARGEEALRAGQVGYVIVAGGQGSRLGLDGPKGLFPVGPVTGRVLFDFHARRLLAAQQKFGAPVPWFVMTSAANDAATRDAFAAADNYGLDSEHVHFFSQEMMPALSTEGRILMSEKHSLFLAPNGHGGSLLALQRSGCLKIAREMGISHLSYFQVDNPLARPADPLFIGLHILSNARMSSKVVPKCEASEKVGVIGKIDGKYGCIEYSDLSDELLVATDDSGELLFKDGNIAVHLIEVDFVDELTKDGLELPWHLARKKMSVLDEAGAPADIDGAKFESFVFDALRFSENSVTLEVDRALEFSPVKNATGNDSPATTRASLRSLFATWAKAAGLEAPATGEEAIEVDPVFAEHLDEFVAKKPSQASGSKGHLYE